MDLRLNKAKIQFKKKEVSFFGHTWNTTGISPDPKKVQAILNMTFPEDKETMHSFLGLINFLKQVFWRVSSSIPLHYTNLHRKMDITRLQRNTDLHSSPLRIYLNRR